jgi:acetyl-CoA carboxylase carboxyl transferase subunit alpha
MAVSFLDFEQPIAELEAKIEELRHVTADSSVNLQDEISRLQAKSRQLTTSIFANLSPWQITQLARHPQRPYSLDYLSMIFTDFQELHGDRMYGDDLAIVGGLARLGGRPVMVIGHQKGRDTKERVRRNYGMPKPEGYRKALRLMRLAERFSLPIVTFIDTPGAYPGVGSEERNQSEAIARNLFEMAVLRVPIVSVVIGEGGSGGALAIGVCDRVADAPVQHLFRHLPRRLRLHPLEERRQEGSGCRRDGPHRRSAGAPRAWSTRCCASRSVVRTATCWRPAETLRGALQRHLDELCAIPPDTLRQQRNDKIAGFGVWSEAGG